MKEMQTYFYCRDLQNLDLVDRLEYCSFNPHAIYSSLKLKGGQERILSE